MKEWKYLLKDLYWYRKARLWRFGGSIWCKLAEKSRLRGDISASNIYLMLAKKWYVNSNWCYDKAIEYITIFRDLRRAK